MLIAMHVSIIQQRECGEAHCGAEVTLGSLASSVTVRMKGLVRPRLPNRRRRRHGFLACSDGNRIKTRGERLAVHFGGRRVSAGRPLRLVTMAKWGQGDPRWIVEERADATNVNNWHWTERDASNWSIDKLKSLLLAVSVENDEGVCKVTEVTKTDGEASINNRKGKLIFFFEWNIHMSWIGTSKTGIKYKGTVEIPNLSDENDIDDVDVTVGLAKDEPDTILLALMKNEGVKKIREALLNYIDTLKLEFTQGMILPTVNGVQKEPSKSKPKVDLQTKVAVGHLPSQLSSVGVKIPTCKFNLKDYFMTSPEELYRIFITQELIQAFTHAPAVVEATKGGKFRLLDGNVSGEFLELVSEQRIIMKWRYKSWPTEHYATIKLSFCSKDDGTELQVECKGVPVGEEEQTKSGWQRYYFEGIKQTFGYNVRLF